MFPKVLVVLATVSTAFANVYVTSPVATSTFAAGQQSTITWQDDGNSPSLSSFGPSKISIYAGNAQQQTILQSLSNSTDVSQVSQLPFTPDPTIGPNSAQYFIRFESLSLADATQPQFPALAFSARFTLSGMTGTFSAAVQSQINGQSTAPLASQSTLATTASTTGAVGVTTVHSTTTAVASSTKATTSAKATSTTSGAMSVRVGWAVAALSAIVGVSMF
ncbi:hypothetical protein HYPSUDRAFT_46016 [Hypholoma sublateritium FD-334 SS-4]|uniref:Yeast cell wall synthesis Kre9/Knh1-like N-terminal domain-containing protein n=1 Tax=Hypholoma sublateritium (strain FD-334 SS-4) TaxID=945553 RepID=A0A0D2NFS4_HYPSF|nr:hypothetical protein HYPSUDRAFT_46016 [Hypholoma sublateritium FD-334 SS-4]